MKQEIWAAPLLLLPGVALLIMSTSVRYTRVHDEIHHQIGGACDRGRLQALFGRARLFHRALVCLYISVAAFAVSSLVGGLLTLTGRPALVPVFVVTCAGIGALVLASVFLIVESVHAIDVIRDHVEEGSEICHDEGGDRGKGRGDHQGDEIGT